MEYKFRVWDYNEKRMIYPEMENEFDLSITDVGLRWTGGRMVYKNEIELMQYTGVKDKNGKEVYDGDILKFDEKEWGSDKGNIRIMEWEEAQAGWSIGIGCISDIKSFCEIIGNIYETPELVPSLV